MENDNLLNEITKEEQEKKDKISLHKDIALKKLNTLLTNYINSSNLMDKADKLSYWLEDYCKLLSFEDEFKPYFLKKYHRGDVLKVNLGYNVGNEEGGLHYCVVLDKNNSIYSGIITVIPLTSDKGKSLHSSEINIGNEIYSNLKIKINLLVSELTHKIYSVKPENLEKKEIDNALSKLSLITKIDKEMAKMKSGSIALVSQITTISKQKIYDPQNTGDILSDIRISNESLELINNKMKKLFIK